MHRRAVGARASATEPILDEWDDRAFSIPTSAPLLEKPKYQAAEYEWMQTGLEIAVQRLRVVRDHLRAEATPAPK